MAAAVPSEHGEPIVGPALEGSGVGGGFSPADLGSAYGLSGLGGEGETIAITIAYDNPNAESDLAVYRNYHGLPPCTTANGCFRKLNQRGEAENYPAPNDKWALETSLDLDMASAICPQCDILLIEADTNFVDDLGVAVQRAADMGATAISNSWGTEEFLGETAENHYFDHPGIPNLFASGDLGYGVSYPAASPDVIAVGGTSLMKSAGPRGWTETAWAGAGSGCSAYEDKPAWQRDGGCDHRTVADVAAVSDPETPVSVYDSYENSGWQLVGGTSAATPILAGIEAISSPEFRAAGASGFARAGAGDGLFDVTIGENGPCGAVSETGFEATYLCQAEVGYDGPTGWGTPAGPLSLPVAVTEPATVSSTGAILHGSIAPGGIATKYRFEYGETTDYGASVPIPDADVGAGPGYVEVSEAIGGLAGRTAYHYRVLASNAAGTFAGVDRTFGTTPPAAISGAADGIKGSAATLHATVNPEGLETSYYFEYGLDTSYGFKRPVRAESLESGIGPVDVSTNIGSLVGGKTYHYRVVAKNVAGATHGSDRIFTTAPAPWTARYLPQPPGSGDGQRAFGISCVGSDECVSVGKNWSLDLHTDVTQAERWDGKSWVAMDTPNPSGLDGGWQFDRYATLLGVSCVAADDCVAVGRYRGSDDVLMPLVERWDGEAWSLTPTALPADAVAAGLAGVSCSSAAACTAVGFRESASGAVATLALRWDGTEWAVQPTSDPAEASSSWLAGVSCPSPTACVAVGTYETDSGAEGTLAAHWDGTAWTSQPTPADPGGRSSARLEGVSCSTTTDCMAVGYFQGTPSVRTLAEQWDGGEWVLRSTPTPYEEGILTGVSCTSPVRCTASGTYYSSSEFDGGWRSLVERWSEAAWTVEEIGDLSVPIGWWRESSLYSISCAVGDLCTAVGDSLAAPSGGLASYRAFAEHEVELQSPSAAFSFDPDQPIEGQPVAFDASASSDPDGTIASYDWDFGDGGHAFGDGPRHAFAHPGEYVVTLSVSDDDGVSGVVSHLVSAAARPQREPDPPPSGGLENLRLPSPPDSAFTVRHVSPRCGGRLLLALQASGPGAFDATATATAVGRVSGKRDSGGSPRLRSCDPGRRQAGRAQRSRENRYGAGRKVATGSGAVAVPAGGGVQLTIALGKKATDAATRSTRLRIALAVTFTPVGGKPQTQTLVVHDP